MVEAAFVQETKLQESLYQDSIPTLSSLTSAAPTHWDDP